jgi:hypothetical protein
MKTPKNSQYVGKTIKMVEDYRLFTFLGDGLIHHLGGDNPKTQWFQRFNQQPISHHQTHAILL